MLRVARLLCAEKQYSMPLEDAIKEHEKLVRILKNRNHPEADQAEADEQGGELKQMLRTKWFGND